MSLVRICTSYHGTTNKYIRIRSDLKLLLSSECSCLARRGAALKLESLDSTK